jgi:paxillin
MDNIEPDNPASRGNCAVCRGTILGEMVQALGRCYHPEHFTCGSCKEPLGTKPFYEANGVPNCENCYQNIFCPKCAHCNNAILDRCITALGKKWHPEHFICGQCLKPFPGGNFFEKDGRPYCETDFFALFASRCGACQEPIKGDCINALGQQVNLNFL